MDSEVASAPRHSAADRHENGIVVVALFAAIATPPTWGTYGHLVRENHERDVEALDLVFWPRTASEDSGEPAESRNSPGPGASPYVPLATGQLSIVRSEAESVVEGKGFVGIRRPRLQ